MANFSYYEQATYVIARLRGAGRAAPRCDTNAEGGFME
jgi:hypothetical protein